MHGTRLKLKTLESSRLDYIYVHVRQEMQANRRSGAKESVYYIYIYIFTVHTVTFTFPGASVHVVKLGIYMYTAYRLDVVRIPTHQARKISLSFSRAMIRGTRKRTMTTLTLYGMLQWAWRHFRNIQVLTARRKLGR